MKALFVVCLLALSASSAFASHYRLPLNPLIGAEETAIFRKHDIQTTLRLLQLLAKPSGRKRVAKQTGLPIERLEVLASQVDLLRIEGVGPSMVLLLQAAGFRDTQALAKTNASELWALMKAANDTHHIAGVVPREPGLHDWIMQARRLAPMVEGLGKTND